MHGRLPLSCDMDKMADIQRMDEEIRNEVCANFHFHLYKFDKQVILNSAEDVRLCLNSKLCMILYKSRNLELIRLDLKHGSSDRIVIPDVKG